MQAYRRETGNVQCSRLARKRGAGGELKSSGLSVMDARESLAEGDRRDGDLWGHICADQWSTDEDSAIEPASCCFARSGVDGFNWRDDARARVPGGQLRYAG